MAQRVAIARALAGDPELLIADEPSTTALDVTVQAEILELFRELQSERGMAILLVAHDWGVIADLCDRAVVMYAGQIVERAELSTNIRSPWHPYTEALLASNPYASDGGLLPTIPGAVPKPGSSLKAVTSIPGAGTQQRSAVPTQYHYGRPRPIGKRGAYTTRTSSRGERRHSHYARYLTKSNLTVVYRPGRQQLRRWGPSTASVSRSVLVRRSRSGRSVGLGKDDNRTVDLLGLAPIAERTPGFDGEDVTNAQYKRRRGSARGLLS